MMFFITSKTFLFYCYFFIISLDSSLNPLFVTLQFEELLCKRMLAIVFFV